MTSNSRHVGDYDVTILNDGPFTSGSDTLVHANGPEAQARMLEAFGNRKIIFDVNLFALRGPGGLTLIDAGTGPDANPTLGQSRAAMQEQGISPDAVDRILLTHLHFDHALGLLDGDKAYFPNAEIWVPAIELAFYTSEAARMALPEARRASFPITERILRAYSDRIRPFVPGTILPSITTVSLPGHTMGQTGFVLNGGSETLVFWGDALHMNELQTNDPDISTIYDYDPRLAARTRRWMLDRAVEDNWLIAGSHLTGFSRVARRGQSYEIVPA